MSHDTDISPNAKEIKARAADWLQRRNFWNWSDDDERALTTWLDESLSHRVAYWRLRSAWERSEKLTALRGPAFGRSDQPMPARRIWPMFRMAAAGVALAAIIGVGVTYIYSAPRGQGFATPIGGREVLTLADGSQVELNTDTAIRVQLTASARRITLEKGEVYFHVVHNAKRPFIVTAGDHRVIDLGTTFFVRRDPGRFEVALIEGRARLESANGKTAAPARDLVPGDVVVATASTVSSQIIPAQKLANDLGWRRGVLVFHGSALADVAEELNRYNTRKIVIADPEVARLTIGATIPTHGVEAFTRVARDVFGLRVANHGNEIVISR